MLQLLLCVGEFFGGNKEEWEKYRTGQKKGKLIDSVWLRECLYKGSNKHYVPM